MNPSDREPQEELLPQNLTLAALSRSDQVAALSRYLIRRLLRRFPYLTEQDTEDIALETLGKITRWERPVRDLRALAHAIAFRAASRRYRLANYSLSTPVGEETELGDLLLSRDVEEIQDLRLALDQALSTLTPQERQLIELTAAGHTLAELTERLGTPRSTLHRHLQEIRQRLQSILSE